MVWAGLNSGITPDANALGIDIPAGAAATPDPFVWGQGGAQLTPDQLALRQKLALQNSQSDYSPIASPWQGLARVAQNVTGALDLKDLDKQSAAQTAAGNQIIQALAGSDPATANPNLVAAALSSGNPQAAKLGMDVFDKAHPKPDQPNEFQQYLIASGVTPGSAEWAKQNAQRAQASYDPIVNVTLPTGVFAGPRSMLPASAPQASGAPQPGQVMDGYRFKGGDPANQANWEKAN